MKTKKEFIALSLSLCILLSACGQQPDLKYADYTETDLLKLEEKSLYPYGEDITLCGHKNGYHGVSVAVSDFAENGKTLEDFASEKSGSEDFNIVEFVKFADISKDSYKEYVDKYYPLDSDRKDKDEILKDREELLADMEIIYCGNETKINNYFNENIQTYSKDENEAEPTKNFFVIHGALIRYVGVEKYHGYLKRVLGSKYDNVVNFIRFFKIDKNTFEKILTEAEDLDFYNISELY